MATIVSALDTEFTPATGYFNAQVTGGMAILQRKNTSGAAWAEAARIHGAAVVVMNEVAGAVYRFTAASPAVGTPVVQADQ